MTKERKGKKELLSNISLVNQTDDSSELMRLLEIIGEGAEKPRSYYRGVRIPENVDNRLRVYSKVRGESISAIIVRALDELLPNMEELANINDLLSELASEEVRGLVKDDLATRIANKLKKDK